MSKVTVKAANGKTTYKYSKPVYNHKVTPGKRLNSKQVSKLKKCLKASRSSIFKDSMMNEDVRFLHINKGSKVLGVCHADVVDWSGQPHRIGTVEHDGHEFIKCMAHDDRVGLYTLLYHLPAMGIELDILVTDNEETGATTAKYVAEHKLDQYNWIVEFDRAGEDVVTYDMDSDDLITRLEDEEFEMGLGSFSDICALGSELARFNVGVGYHREHSMECFLDDYEYVRQMDKFASFYHKWKDTRMEMDERMARIGSYDTYAWDDDPYYLNRDEPVTIGKSYGNCEECGVELDEADYISTYDMCAECADEILNGGK